MRRPTIIAVFAVAGLMAASAIAAPRHEARRVSPAAGKERAVAPAATEAGRLADAIAREATVSVCYNYGCLTEREVRIDGATLEAIRQRLAAAADAPGERRVLAEAVGTLYGVAGRQTPIGADRAGNFLDQEVEGRMDCIDHSTSTTRLLKLIEARGWLGFHRVLEPARRTRLILQHFGAVVEEVVPPGGAAPGAVPTAGVTAVPDYAPVMLALCDCPGVDNDAARAVESRSQAGAAASGERYVIDSWFVDNGEAAVVLPLAEWLDGGGPNVQ